GHFPEGEVAFNTYPRYAVKALRHFRATRAVAAVARHPGFDDPRDPERWAPALKLVEELFLSRRPEVATLPLPERVISRLMARSAALSRKTTAVNRYRF